MEEFEKIVEKVSLLGNRLITALETLSEMQLELGRLMYKRKKLLFPEKTIPSWEEFMEKRKQEQTQ